MRAVPTYDYECRSCGNRIEVIHSMLDDGPSTCEVCGGALRRVIYPTGIIFKGSGFYKTDSRSAAASSSGSSTPAAASGDGASTDGAGKASGADAAPSTATEGGSPPSPKKKATGEKSGSSAA